MVDIAVLMGATREAATEELLEALEFMMNIAKITIPKESRRNRELLVNVLTIVELQEKYPFILWLDYIKQQLPEGVEVDENSSVNLDVPDYFPKLIHLLETTPKRVQANHIMWRAVHECIPQMTEELTSRAFEFVSAVAGSKAEQPDWKKCVSLVKSFMPIATSALYVRKHFKLEDKLLATEMVSEIQQEFIRILENVDWMDDVTRQRAMKKASAISHFIAYPHQLLDDKYVEECYKDLTIDSDKYLESVLRISVFTLDTIFKKLHEPVNKKNWKKHAAAANVNAYYSFSENIIEFPAGILQGVLFDAKRPKYMNFGAIGYVIGHEITHGFDDVGRQYDEIGNLVEWWAATTKASFVEKAKCIVEQYNNYTQQDVNMTLNGEDAQGENIADNGGVKTAYQAYNKWVLQHGEEPRLPGLDYTPKQMFWISAANTWCAKYRPEYLQLTIISDNHSPGDARVLVPFRNMVDFSTDFQCPPGSPMNPAHKCQVW